MSGYAKVSGILIMVGLVSVMGCSSMIDHSNTMVFGTETTFAIDASTSTTSQVPQLTVGYKRTEAVWLPLLANTGERDNRVPAGCGNDCVFEGDENQDTYSVLASFGADFGGEAGASVQAQQDGTTPAEYKNAVNGGIAQYFATGLAARSLAEKGGASLVTVQAANTAKAEAKVAMLEEQRAALEKRLGKTRIAVFEQNAKVKAAEDEALRNVIMARVAPNNELKKDKLTAAVNSVLTNEEVKKNLEGMLNALKNKQNAGDVNAMLKRIADAATSLTTNPLALMAKDLL